MKLKNALGIIIAVVLGLSPLFPYPVLAQEFSVSGNGAGSSNNISYQAETNNQIQQTNNEEIENNVGAEAETGGNEADGNSGEVEINTGDVTGEIVILNTGNSSTAQIGCCEEEDPSSAAITGNGEDSDNSIDISDNLATKINIFY